MAKRDRKERRRIPSVKKETIRALSADDLEQVQGGWIPVGKQPYTSPCGTCN